MVGKFGEVYGGPATAESMTPDTANDSLPEVEYLTGGYEATAEVIAPDASNASDAVCVNLTGGAMATAETIAPEAASASEGVSVNFTGGAAATAERIAPEVEKDSDPEVKTRKKDDTEKTTPETLNASAESLIFLCSPTHL
jgi:hypothetical protein